MMLLCLIYLIIGLILFLTSFLSKEETDEIETVPMSRLTYPLIIVGWPVVLLVFIIAVCLPWDEIDDSSRSSNL